MNNSSPYLKSHNIMDNNFGSCVVYYMKPETVEKKHYHNAVEIEYVLRGNCKTHKQGKVYIYQKGKIHEVINDSKEELVFVCLTIPPESEKNTVYV